MLYGWNLQNNRIKVDLELRLFRQLLFPWSRNCQAQLLSQHEWEVLEVLCIMDSSHICSSMATEEMLIKDMIENSRTVNGPWGEMILLTSPVQSSLVQHSNSIQFNLNQFTSVQLILMIFSFIHSFSKYTVDRHKRFIDIHIISNISLFISAATPSPTPFFLLLWVPVVFSCHPRSIAFSSNCWSNRPENAPGITTLRQSSKAHPASRCAGKNKVQADN